MSERALTCEQQVAIDTQDRAVTLLAGAGSGKTTVLVERYLSFLSQGIKPHQLLTVTFTTEAANQMRERIAARLRNSGADSALADAVEETPNIGTIHSFCYGVLDRFGSAVGLPGIAKIQSHFELAFRFDAAYRSWLERLSEDSLAYLLAHFSHQELRTLTRALYASRFTFERSMKRLSGLAPSEDSQLLLRVAELVSPLLSDLERDFQAEGIYSFDDLENLALRVLERSPAAVTRLRAQFRHFLVDEFQDTSRLQWEILGFLVGNDRGKLFVVGDPKQSIYSFRHADYRLFLEVAERMRDNGGVVQELSANFRSRPALVDAVNRVSEALFRGTDIPFHPMRSGREAGDGREGIRINRYQTEEKRRDSARLEMRAVVSRVKRFMEEGGAPEELAILFRVTDRIPAYHEALTEAGIPCSAKRTTKLFEYYDIVDIVSYLKACLNPLDDFALASFLRSSSVRMSERELWDITRSGEGSLYEKLARRSDARVAWFFAFIESGAFDVESALMELWAHSPYFPKAAEAYLELLAPLYPDSEPNSLTLAEAVRRVETWEREEILLSAETGTATGGGVRLMTVHGAKGLEFPHVYLVDNLRPLVRRTPVLRLDPELPPGIRYRSGGETIASPAYEALTERQVKNDLEESKRILYVALTRAKETLTIFLPRDPSEAPKNSWAEWLESAIGEATKS